MLAALQVRDSTLKIVKEKKKKKAPSKGSFPAYLTDGDGKRHRHLPHMADGFRTKVRAVARLTLRVLLHREDSVTLLFLIVEG